jgi:hypothetical protein
MVDIFWGGHIISGWVSLLVSGKQAAGRGCSFCDCLRAKL